MIGKFARNIKEQQAIYIRDLFIYFFFCGRLSLFLESLTVQLTAWLNGVKMVKTFCGLGTILGEVILFLLGIHSLFAVCCGWVLNFYLVVVGGPLWLCNELQLLLKKRQKTSD